MRICGTRTYGRWSLQVPSVKRMDFNLQNCVWEITLSCCFSCKYCGSMAGVSRPNELTTVECLSVANQLAELGCQHVSLIGGEVFMRPDWAEIAQALTGLGIRVSIITNGFLFSNEVVDTLQRIRIESVAVSVDGPARIHDKYRQSGSYARALNAIHTLATHGIPTSVITTLHSENTPYLDEMLQQLSTSGISAWQLQACCPMGNAEKTDLNFRIDPRTVISFVDTHLSTAPFLLGIADNIGYFTPEEGRLRGNPCGRAIFQGCQAGISSIGIDSVGNVRGCESMYDESFIEGNLRYMTLKEIWESPNSFLYNRRFHPNLLTGACATCPHGPSCAGGCRSYNYFVHKHLYESPFCARNIDSVPNTLL